MSSVFLATVVRHKRPLPTIEEEGQTKSRKLSEDSHASSLKHLLEAVEETKVSRRCDIDGYALFLYNAANYTGKLLGVSAEVARTEFERMVYLKLFLFDESGERFQPSKIMEQMWKITVLCTRYYEALQKKIGMKMHRPIRSYNNVSEMTFRVFYRACFREDAVGETPLPEKQFIPENRVLVVRDTKKRSVRGVVVKSALGLTSLKSNIARDFSERVAEGCFRPSIPVEATIAQAFPDHKVAHILNC